MCGFKHGFAPQDYASARIYMTSVDTGWINDENPLEKAARVAADNNFQTPLDEVRSTPPPSSHSCVVQRECVCVCRRTRLRVCWTPCWTR